MKSEWSITSACSGDRVCIIFRANTLPSGKALDHWIINGVDSNIDDQVFMFDMPDYDVTFEPAYCDAITSIEISGDFSLADNLQVYDTIPIVNATVTKVNGGTDLLDKVNMVYAKWVKITNYVDLTYTENYVDFTSSGESYFENGARYMFVLKIESTDPDYAFKGWRTNFTIHAGGLTYDNNSAFRMNYKDSSSHQLLIGYEAYDQFVTVEEGYHRVAFYTNNGNFEDNVEDTCRSYVVPDGGDIDSWWYSMHPSVPYDESDNDDYIFEFWGATGPEPENKEYEFSNSVYENKEYKACYMELMDFPTWSLEGLGVTCLGGEIYLEQMYSGDDYISTFTGYNENKMEIEYPEGPFVAPPGGSISITARDGDGYFFYFTPKYGYGWNNIPYYSNPTNYGDANYHNERVATENNEQRKSKQGLGWMVLPISIEAPYIDPNDADYMDEYNYYNGYGDVTVPLAVYYYTGETITPSVIWDDSGERFSGTNCYDLLGDTFATDVSDEINTITASVGSSTNYWWSGTTMRIL